MLAHWILLACSGVVIQKNPASEKSDSDSGILDHQNIKETNSKLGERCLLFVLIVLIVHNCPFPFAIG
jgi:hypothetical protein